MSENNDNANADNHLEKRLPQNQQNALSYRFDIVNNFIGREMLESVTEGDINISPEARIIGSVKNKDRKILVQLGENDPEIKDYKKKTLDTTTLINQTAEMLKEQGQANIDKSSQYADQTIEGLRNNSSLPESIKASLIETLEGVINNAGNDLKDSMQKLASSATNSIKRSYLEYYAYRKVYRLIQERIYNLFQEMKLTLKENASEKETIEKAESLENEIKRWTAIGIHASDLFEHKQTQITLQEKYS